MGREPDEIGLEEEEKSHRHTRLMTASGARAYTKGQQGEVQQISEHSVTLV